MPRYRVTWDGGESGSDGPIEVKALYLDEDSFWHEKFRDSKLLEKLYLHVEVEEIEEEARAPKGRRRRPATPKDESR